MHPFSFSLTPQIPALFISLFPESYVYAPESVVKLMFTSRNVSTVESSDSCWIAPLLELKCEQFPLSNRALHALFAAVSAFVYGIVVGRRLRFFARANRSIGGKRNRLRVSAVFGIRTLQVWNPRSAQPIRSCQFFLKTASNFLNSDAADILVARCGASDAGGYVLRRPAILTYLEAFLSLQPQNLELSSVKDASVSVSADSG